MHWCYAIAVWLLAASRSSVAEADSDNELSAASPSKNDRQPDRNGLRARRLRRRLPQRTQKTRLRGLRTRGRGFVCTPPGQMGLCTATASEDTDECSNVGLPCLDGYEGEHCCVDKCGRKYCTAKGRWQGPDLTQAAMDLDDDDVAEENVVELDMDWMNGPAAPAGSPTRAETQLTPFPTELAKMTNEDLRRDDDLVIGVGVTMDVNHDALQTGAGATKNVDSFSCTPPKKMGLCTGTDQNDPDECSIVGEPCPGRGGGEYCCVDLCKRRYCTAKGQWQSPGMVPAMMDEMDREDVDDDEMDFPVMIDDLIRVEPMERLSNRLEVDERPAKDGDV